MTHPSVCSLLALAGYLFATMPLAVAWSATLSRPATSIFSKHFPNVKTKGQQKNHITLTYLEINGYLLTVDGVTMLIDPILEGPLDFGIPDLYTANKKAVPMMGLCEKLPPIDCILLTQGLDDHAHVKTLSKLSRDPAFQEIPVVAPPSAKGALQQSGMLSAGTVQFLKHGETTTIEPRCETSTKGAPPKSGEVSIRATQGALVGPPWQTRENGYILRTSEASSLYIEPHAEFNVKELSKEAPVDIVITPIVGQRLPILDLVFGPANAVQLLETLKPKIVVTMPNANVQQEGALAELVTTVGSQEEFFDRLEQSDVGSKRSDMQVISLTPGKDYDIAL